MKRKSYKGIKVNVSGKGNGVIVGYSRRFNGTWLMLIDGKKEEVHDQYVKTEDGSSLPSIP